MRVKMLKARRAAMLLQPRTRREKKTGVVLTTIRLNGEVEAASVDGWLCFWVAGREVRVGPLTPDQAEKLSEDLGYDAVA